MCSSSNNNPQPTTKLTNYQDHTRARLTALFFSFNHDHKDTELLRDVPAGLSFNDASPSPSLTWLAKSTKLTTTTTADVCVCVCVCVCVIGGISSGPGRCNTFEAYWAYISLKPSPASLGLALGFLPFGAIAPKAMSRNGYEH